MGTFVPRRFLDREQILNAVHNSMATMTGNPVYTVLILNDFCYNPLASPWGELDGRCRKTEESPNTKGQRAG